jgi:xanthine dehydrogenase iron-sulfur cluster and FAD-binding subunit A
MISHFDFKTERIVHRAANACLTPVCSLDGFSVTTGEAIVQTSASKIIIAFEQWKGSVACVKDCTQFSVE